MLFNSLHFLAFFPIVTVAYFLLPHRARWALLLVASAYFYMAFIPKYVLVLVALILIDYVAGLAIEASAGARRKLLLVVSILANVLVLATFKYFNFLNGNLTALANALHVHYAIPNLSWILPIGLSFHTFQSMAYTIEVYRGAQKAERNLGIYALYVMFYPQLVAGPIERPQNLLHQFVEPHRFDTKRALDGLRLMLIGLFKKTVIADTLAVTVDKVYGNPSGYGSLALALGTYFYAFQIYCDFSGYSDMARGAARVMGYELMENFRQPYGSSSVAEFWKRWHISLSTWFRDYLYIPLGGNRLGKSRWYFNLFFVFLVSGLWHGPNWTFVVWGALHGTFLVVALWTADARKEIRETLGFGEKDRVTAAWRVFVVFNLVALAWIFFRADSLSKAWYITTHLFSTSGATTGLASLGAFDLVLSVVLIFALEGLHLLQRRVDFFERLRARPTWQRWGVYYVLALTAIGLTVMRMVSMPLQPQQFIYFQF